MWGKETFVTTHLIPRRAVIQLNCTLQEAGIVGDTLLTLETTEDKTVDFKKLHVSSSISICNLVCNILHSRLFSQEIIFAASSKLSHFFMKNS